MISSVTLPEHLEAYLGEIQGGWSRDAAGDELPFKVVDFARGPRKESAAFATLGLSKFPLRSRTTGKTIFQELLIAVPESRRSAPVPGILQDVGRELLGLGQALLRGDVIGPRGPLFASSSKMEALYAAIPVYLPQEFATFREHDREVVIVWLIPISRGEAEFVRSQGWSRFEDELVEQGPDLIDMEREPLFPWHAD